MRRILLIVCLGLLAAYALTGVTQVRPGERAVVRRFGRVLADKPKPGLLVGLPWGMDRVDRVAVDRVQSVVVGFQPEETTDPAAMPAGQFLTGDHNLVNVQLTLTYKVRPDAVEKFLVQADRVDGLVSRAAEASTAEWVAARDIDDVLLHAKTHLGPEVVERTRRRADDYELGVQLLDARVNFVTPPDEVKPAFDKVAAAQTAIHTLKNKAEQDAASNERAALADKFRIEQEAAGYAHAQKEKARGDADRFLARLAQYEAARAKNPDYLRQIWEEERGKLLAQLKKDGRIGLLDHHLGPDGLDMTIAPPLPK
jgi:membrane protease subunit HflK